MRPHSKTERSEFLRKTLLMVLAALLIVATAADANAFRLGVGAFGGLNIPIAMEDAESSTTYGAKARLYLMPNIAVEPNFYVADYRDPEVDVYGDMMERDAGSITHIGVDLVFFAMSNNTGLSFFAFGGIGSSKWSRDYLDDVSEVSYNGGFGFEYGVNEMISLELRARLLVIPFEDGSYKNGLITGGLNYYFDLGGM